MDLPVLVATVMLNLNTLQILKTEIKPKELVGIIYLPIFDIEKRNLGRVGRSGNSSIFI